MKTARALMGKAAAAFATVLASLCLKADVVYPVDGDEAQALGGAYGEGHEIRLVEEGTGDDAKYYLVHIFTNTSSQATLTIPTGNSIVANSAEILLVGGGGAGGGDCGGGGGAGGLVHLENQPISAGAWSVDIGAGGTCAYNEVGLPGGASAISNKTTTACIALALGGGGGGRWSTYNESRMAGGSGGGAGGYSANVSPALQPTAGYPVGGYGNTGAQRVTDANGGGGGGAGGVGSSANDGATHMGDGGPGLEFDITGESRFYAAGGGGGGTGGFGVGGSGIGGNGTLGTDQIRVLLPTAGKDGTGSGGGGGGGGGSNTTTRYGGTGGTGIAVVRYQITPKATVKVAEVDEADAVAQGGATGGDIVYQISGNGTIDFVHVFTNAAEAAEFTVPANAKVIPSSGRFLAVGGGGAGGSGYYDGTYAGAGGGGGAGGFVEGAFEVAPGSVYSVKVGAGGTPANHGRGGNGGDSALTNATTSAGIAWALGGGGGGTGAGNSAGRKGLDGGSGGGGSRDNNGGLALQGTEGYPAGLGSNAAQYSSGGIWMAGGGGGAGGEGAKKANGNPVAEGDFDGGAGYASDITGWEVFYAAGGGGGCGETGSDYNRISSNGGSGIGGDGEVNAITGAATAGRAATGSGGGGGGGGEGAAGGSGVVIVRYSVVLGSYAAGAIETQVGGQKVYGFTNTVSSGSFTLGGAAQVRVLAVGGGGGGGSGAVANSSTAGGNGGGGAGGFVDVTNVWKGATYSIIVGAGGAAGANVSSASRGTTGGSTSITNANESAEVIVALGGGGGGAGNAGLPGGSGGGGTRRAAGGNSIQASTYGYGVGNKGGCTALTSYARAGGGGGGAGEAGKASSAADRGGDGGDGLTSNITGSDVWYAGGGAGGAYTFANGGAGGNGGGGSPSSKNGVPGTGGGGAGGGLNNLGGAGGSGVVYIRIIRMMPEGPGEDTYEYEYDSTEHVAYELPAEDADVLTITTADNIETNRIAAVAKGTYVYTVAIKDEFVAQGFMWYDGTPGTVKKTVTLVVNKSPTSIDYIHQAGWQIGEERPATVVETTPSGVAYILEYSETGDPNGTWTTTFDETPGTHYIRARIEETEDTYASVSAVESFKVWEWSGDNYPSYLGYHTDIYADATVFAGVNETLKDFPMLVRISEALVPGFYTYANSPDGYEGIRFTARGESGAVEVPFELVEWNPSGESIYWVKAPSFAPGEYAVTLNYGDIGGELPENNPQDVWSDYTGVWHFDEAITAESAATAKSADATANGYDAVPTLGTNAGGATIQNQMVSTDAVFGRGRVNSTGNYTGGNRLVAEGSEAAVFEEALTFTGWVKIDGINGSNIIVSRKQAGADSNGWQLGLWGVSSTGSLAIWGSSNSANGPTVSSTSLAELGGYFYVGLTYNGSNRAIVYNNTYYNTYSGQAAATDNDLAIAFGGGAGTGSQLSLYGAYDEFRLRKGAVSRAWMLAEYLQGTLSAANPGITVSEPAITPGATFANRWLEEPSIDRTAWTAGSAGGRVSGRALYGALEYCFTALDGTAVTNEMPTVAGDYILDFFVEPGEMGTCKYGGLVFEYDGVISIGAVNEGEGGLAGGAGSATLSGRTLLANDDDLEGFEIANQSYWNTNETSAAFWVHEGEDSSVLLMPFMHTRTVHTLVAKEPVAELFGARSIWHMEDVRIGNTYPANLEESDRKNFLPWSTTSKVLDEDGANYLSGNTAANSINLVMRNTLDAVVYSPCYTNGIGTIYFDAVNGWTADASTARGCTIIVEVATNCVESVGEDVYPTDDALYGTWTTTTGSGEDEVVTEHEGVNYSKADWKAVAMTPLYYDGKKFNSTVVNNFGSVTNTIDGTVTALHLDVTAGGTHERFYRVYVPVYDLLGGYRGPARFRIRRASTSSASIDGNAFILLDNIVVSYPAMTSNLSPEGLFDASRVGKRVLGQECAFDVPFPAAGEDVTARAAVSYETNPLVPGADTSKFVTSAKVNYRWRYGNQIVGDWLSAPLNPATFEGISTLNLEASNGLPGDLEFFFDLRQSAPYYTYTDYSGLGLSFDGIYSENIPAVTNRCGTTVLESLGTDWFIRQREGRSPYESLEVDVDAGSVTNTVYMDIVSDGTWRGYYQTPTGDVGTVSFRVRACNRQEPGEDFAANEAIWYAGASQPLLPFSNVMEIGTEDTWTQIEIDAKTGYLMFQVDDSSRSVTCVHADYQDFNSWSDANKTIFVGNSTENDKKSGTSSSKKTISQDFETWSAMSATRDDWFAPNFEDVNHMLGHPTYETFSTDTTPNGWDVGEGRWISKRFRQTTDGSGVALQMAGEGKGRLQYTKASLLPRGIASVNFNARIAQSISFYDFCCYYGGNCVSLTNYTFCAPARMRKSNGDNFDGDGSVSLVAAYQPGRGCYEFRAVRVDTSDVMLQLWKWKGNKATLLGEKRHNGQLNTGNDSCGLMNGNTGMYGRMFLSVSNGVNGVTVSAAVSRRAVNISDSQSTSAFLVLAIQYLDTNQPYTKGTFGVLSASCPADFTNMRYYLKPMVFDPENAGKVTDGNFTSWGSSFYANYPTTSASEYHYITEDEMDGWSYDDVRMTRSTTSSYQSISALKPTQTLKLMTAEEGTTDWKTAATVTVNSFSNNLSPRVNLYNTTNSIFKVETGGTYGDGSCDVVIDSLRLWQFRGADWNEDSTELSTLIPGYQIESSRFYNPTNFTFYSGWITNLTVSGKSETGILLSARRTKPGTSASIKSPLFDGYSGRGKGLGMISFDYINAQPNVVLDVQVATNGVGELNYPTLNDDDTMWETVTNISFATATDRTKGVRSVYLGYHGVTGAFRIRMNPGVVSSVASTTDTSKFGDIIITAVKCTDEPALDERSWWGWNIRSIGDPTDEERRMYLPDMATSSEYSGMCMAINNSLDDTDPAEADLYKANMPFVQSPTFGTNLVGEVAFRARKYGYTDAAAEEQDAYVTLLGAKDGNASEWTSLTNFCVSSKTYARYSFKTETGQDYFAFRLAVTGANGVANPGPVAGGYDSPVRVLVDEVVVTEAVRAKIALTNVGAFRGNPKTRSHIMNDLLTVPYVPGAGEQPLCNEAWGVQCEIYKALLPDEIDFVTRPPEVKVHYMAGVTPWGWENWKTNSAARVCTLDLAEDSAVEDHLVFRSSYVNGTSNVLPVVPSSASLRDRIYQYMVEVVYYQTGSSTPLTNFLASTEWSKPEWYRGIDYNSQYGGFSAYCIMDTVAPGWAWINEVNINGLEGTSTSNREKSLQFAELAVPAEADISGWKLRMLWADSSNDGVITNTCAVFGTGADRIPGTKPGLVGQAQSMVFRTVGGPLGKSSGDLVDYNGEQGTLDGVWTWNYDENPDIASKLRVDGDLSQLEPVGLQLVRASGVIEHEVVAIGYNWWAGTTVTQYDPTNTVNYLNAHMADSKFFFAGEDTPGLGTSLNVFDSCGENENVWTNGWVLTPGRINKDASGNMQNIDPDHPKPNGDTVIVYCNLDTASGSRLYQSIDGGPYTNVSQIVFLDKGNKNGLPIRYSAEPWFRLASVTTNALGGAAGEVPFEAVPGEERVWLATVGVYASNNFTVVASPKVLDEAGLDTGDRYYDAMVDWLASRRHADGTPWANEDSDALVTIPFYRAQGFERGEFVTNISVKMMYWLDLDPTLSNQVMCGGLSHQPTVQPRKNGTLDNVILGVRIWFTNETEDAASPYYGKAWAPNVLRGLAPGETSWNTPLSNWTSETFKVTGIIMNGLTSKDNAENWVPLRYFVFQPDSFDATFNSEIEIVDMYSRSSPGYPQWRRSFELYGKSLIGLFWMIDDRGSVLGVEDLKKENYYNYNEGD